jgi:hypothetical protein
MHAAAITFCSGFSPCFSAIIGVIMAASEAGPSWPPPGRTVAKAARPEPLLPFDRAEQYRGSRREQRYD